jgi:3-deoxy-manno-octulosonate cytidylyltransferase (CMP-KDO synthetase)
MDILAVIPARYNSQRFPGKPLAMIGKYPMIQWVYEAALNCNSFKKVIVATDSEKIADCVRAFGGYVEMTSSEHLSGTDRVAEVAEKYENIDVIANIQGDQPFVSTKMIEELLKPYLNGQFPDMTTLACPLDMKRGYFDPNVVKVLCDKNNKALYFSRAPIPYFRNEGTVPVYQHIGLYAFRRDFLLNYKQLQPTQLEYCEGLEQLRVLENGYDIIVGYIDEIVFEVNTPNELVQAQKYIQNKK